MTSISENWTQVASDASEYASTAEKGNVAAATFLTKLATLRRFNALYNLAVAEQGMAHALVGAPTTSVQSISIAERNLAIAKEKLEKARIAAYTEVPDDLGSFLTLFPAIRAMVFPSTSNVAEERRRIAAAAPVAPAAPTPAASAAPAAPAAAAASGGVFSYVKSFFGRRGPTSRRTRSSRQTRRNH